MAEGLLWDERYAEAAPLIEAYTRHAERDRYAPSIVHSLGLQSLLLTGCGDLGAARGLASKALTIAGDEGFGQLIHTVYARLMATSLNWLAGSLEDAESAAVELQRLIESSIDVPMVVQHAVLRSRVRRSLGDRPGARDLLDRGLVDVIGRPIVGHFADRLRFARASLDLMDSDPEGAARHLPDWKDRIEVPPSTMREWLVLMRFLIATDSDLAPVLAEPPASLTVTPLQSIDLARLRSLALLRLGRRDEAVDTLTGALSRAMRLEATQPFVDDADNLGHILQVAATRLGAQVRGLETRTPGAAPIGTAYVEPLTGREEDVLALMATHLTYSEVAAELFASTNTVKSHARAIFRKLAVSRRSDAVAVATSLGLINGDKVHGR